MGTFSLCRFLARSICASAAVLFPPPACISGLSWTKVIALHRAVRRPKSQLWLWPLHSAFRWEVLDGVPTSPFPTSLPSHYRTSADVRASALEVKPLFYRLPLPTCLTPLRIQMKPPYSERACACTTERVHNLRLIVQSAAETTLRAPPATHRQGQLHFNTIFLIFLSPQSPSLTARLSVRYKKKSHIIHITPLAVTWTQLKCKKFWFG